MGRGRQGRATKREPSHRYITCHKEAESRCPESPSAIDPIHPPFEALKHERAPSFPNQFLHNRIIKKNEYTTKKKRQRNRLNFPVSNESIIDNIR